MNDEELKDLLFDLGYQVTNETFVSIAEDEGFTWNARKQIWEG